jgi:hypothetical protein
MNGGERDLITNAKGEQFLVEDLPSDAHGSSSACPACWMDPTDHAYEACPEYVTPSTVIPKMDDPSTDARAIAPQSDADPKNS